MRAATATGGAPADPPTAVATPHGPDLAPRAPADPRGTDLHTFDLLATGGAVLDGTGSPARRADVGIRDDRIVLVGEAPAGSTARETLDCTGLLVTPGFVDLHSHADFTIRGVPRADACIRQGVTTLVTGNCGSSPFPTDPEHSQALSMTMRRGDGSDPSTVWLNFAGFARDVEAAGPSVNIAALVGHAALRIAVVGTDMRQATGDEIAAMRALLAEAAAQGVFGLSTGLIYAPGSFADTDEVVALATEAGAAGLLYSTHMRDEGDRLLEAVAEAVQTARRGAVRLQISHLKAMGPANHGKVREALALIDAARAEGLDVACDVYPYTASSTRLTSRLPDWAMDGGPDALLDRLADPQIRAAIAAELRAKTGRTFLPEGTVLAAMPEGRYSDWTGSSLQEFADHEQIDPAEAALTVLHAHQANVWIINHAMAQADVDTVLRHESCALGSDGWELDLSGGGHPHPRHFGAFARALGELTRERSLLTLPEAVRKMTTLPASRLGLTDRGQLTDGAHADLAVLDPAAITDTATYAAPLSYARGVRHVVVNGRTVLRDGDFTEHRPGRVLRRHA